MGGTGSISSQELDEKKEKEKQCDLGDGLELWDDGVYLWKDDKPKKAKKKDALPRTDLSPGHWLYGQYSVKCLPSGMTDKSISEDGSLVDVELEEIEKLKEKEKIVKK